MLVDITYYVNDYYISKGKILGFIDDRQFAVLNMNTNVLANKVGTGEIKSLKDISVKEYAIGKRLVLGLIDSRNKRKLLITGHITELESMAEKGEVTEVTLADDQDNFMILEKCAI